MIISRVSCCFFNMLCFSSFFLGFHRDVTTHQIVLEKGDCLFLPSQWIHFVYTPEESVAFGCNFIMEKHMYRSALAFEKELEQGFQPFFAFPHFEALVAIFLYREWSYRHRSESAVSKVELTKMLAIIKADQRRHPKGKGPFESPWEVSIYMYSESTWGFHWDEIESWVQQN